MIHPAYRMGGCSGRILTFAYAEAFHFLVALEPLHFVWSSMRWVVQPETPSRRGPPQLEPTQQRWIPPHAASWGRSKRSCSQAGWRMALDPQPLLQAKLGRTCCRGINQEFGICRAGKYCHSPTAQAGLKHGKGKRYKQEDWVMHTASGKEKELGNKAIVSLYLRAAPG